MKNHFLKRLLHFATEAQNRKPSRTSKTPQNFHFTGFIDGGNTGLEPVTAALHNAIDNQILSQKHHFFSVTKIASF